MPRVKRDIRRCVDFVRRQPLGKPYAREADIYRGIGRVLANPEAHRREQLREDTGIWLRQCPAAQFVIVYAYLSPPDTKSAGVVSIRAVRHSREKDVFAGVRESPAGYGPPDTLG
jgi:hypothetical protein